ncbi:beta-2 adrenergic receptor-like [Montipora capricornis]|uniref:beta-2 adrenergic receptor-like n=1 Tax=Montipora capricornis TaxID=246305 RepID=UPI0035F16723
MEKTTDNSTNTDNSTFPSKGAVITSSIVLFVFGLAGNGMIVYGYFRFRRLRTRTNYFVLNLAIADLLLTVGLGAWIIEELRGNPSEKFLRAFMISIDILCFSASMLSMTAVSVDRFFAVTSPLKYNHKITRSRAHMATLLIWLYSLVMFVIGVSRYYVEQMESAAANKIFMTTLTVTCFVIPALIMVYAHVSVFRIALISKRETPDVMELTNGRSKEMSKTVKLSFNTLVILVPMTTAWGIFFGVTVYEAHCTNCRIPTSEFSTIVGFLPYIAAAIDPIVYILLSRDLRLKLCRCL